MRSSARSLGTGGGRRTVRVDLGGTERVETDKSLPVGTGKYVKM